MDTIGLLSQLGIMNPFGRKQETEADYLGLIFSSLSGFNINESVKLWERMSEAKKGKEPPQFLSTHPSSKNRVENDLIDIIPKDRRKIYNMRKILSMILDLNSFFEYFLLDNCISFSIVK